VVDFVHVLEYLWRAAWCFFAEGDPAAQTWVHDHARSVLHGRASIVAGAIRRKATRNHLDLPSASLPTPPRPTCSTRSPTWTTRPPSPLAGRSPPA